MRVLHVTGAYPPMRCGVGDYTAQLVDALAGMKEVVAGVLTSTAAATNASRNEAFFPVMDSWGFASLPTFLKTLDMFRPDIVHLQYPASFGRVFLPNFLPLICKRRGIDVIQTWHEHPIYSQIINAAAIDALVLIDPEYPASYRQPYRYLVRRSPCVHIPIGSNISAAHTLAQRKGAIRETYGALGKRLLVYFGFAGPGKGIELLFQAADPQHDRIVLICDLKRSDPYHAAILGLAESDEWRGNCCVTGYLPDSDTAELLDTADAAVFPFRDGYTPRNGSVLAARLQGTFVITTHQRLRGYVPSENVYYVAPGDVAGIHQAIGMYAGTTRAVGTEQVIGWDEIAARHCRLYTQVLASRGMSAGGFES